MQTVSEEVVFMDIKKIIPIICMLSVGVMVVWGLLANDWSKSWIAVVIGGIIVACLSVWNGMNKNK